MSESSVPSKLVNYWLQGRYTLLTCSEQLEELRRVTRYPKVRVRLSPATAGRFVNDLHSTGEFITGLPVLDISPDPWDNYLLGLAEAGKADVLVTGDKADLLSLGRHGITKFLSARDWLHQLECG